MDLNGYFNDPKSKFHLSNMTSIHQGLKLTYEANLENNLIPLIELVEREIK